MATLTESVAMARPAFWGGNWLRAIAMVTGSSPRPNPCRPRPMTRTAKPVETAEMTQPTSTAPRATSTTLRLRGPSARRPMAGVARAPVISVAVSTHSAALSETWYDWAIEGMRGAPKLETTATRPVTPTRTGRAARWASASNAGFSGRDRTHSAHLIGPALTLPSPLCAPPLCHHPVIAW